MAGFGYAEYDYEFGEDQDVEYVDYYEDQDLYEMPMEEEWEEDPERDGLPSQLTVQELYEYCVVPTVSDSSKHLYNLLLWSLLFALGTRIVHPPAWVVHVLSAVCGCLVAGELFGPRTIYMAALLAVGAVTLILSHIVVRSRRGPWTCVTCVIFLIVCECCWASATDWHSIRGPQMIILMKVVSLGYDLDSASLAALPGPLELVGYVFNPGTIIFGPWLSFKSYLKVLQPLSRNWLVLLLLVVVRIFASVIFLLFSTCFTPWLISDSVGRWALAYRDALSFRSSHYFVSYFSEASALLAGLEIGRVARPEQIELPRSLVEVVIFWNMPMHYWLKTYVFKTAKLWLGSFPAILLTYTMSALFHGLNFQLAAVLLSLGAYTYVEHSLRGKLASAFDACVLARPCAEKCNHRQKGRSWLTIAINLAFGGLAMFHLAYLGIMFDSSSQQQEVGYSMKHTLGKWHALGFSSHWVVLICYVVNSLI